VDLVFETEDGKLIIVEVKSTIEPGRVWCMYEDVIKSLKVEPGYIELIKEHGLKKGGVKINKEDEVFTYFFTTFDSKRMSYNEKMRLIKRAPDAIDSAAAKTSFREFEKESFLKKRDNMGIHKALKLRGLTQSNHDRVQKHP
jgi:hypothetical protein